MKKGKILFLSIFALLLAVVGVVFQPVESVQASSGYSVTFHYNTDNLSIYVPSSIKNISDYTYTSDGKYASEPNDYAINNKLDQIKLYYTYTWTVDGEAINLNLYQLSKDTTFVAKWTPKNYSISYMYSTEKEKSEIKNIQYGTTYNIESGIVYYYTPIRDNYIFLGWTSISDEEPKMFLDKGNIGSILLYANWKPVEFYIDYHTDAINTLNPTTYNIETDFTFVEPIKEGHIFKGWYKDVDRTIPFNKITAGSTGDLDVYPLWEKEKYQVTYILPNGSREIVMTKYGEKAKLPDVEKSIFEIIITDVSRSNITGDTTIKIEIKNIWYVYLIGFILIVGLITLIIIIKIRRNNLHKKLRYIYQSNMKSKGIRRK